MYILANIESIQRGKTGIVVDEVYFQKKYDNSQAVNIA